MPSVITGGPLTALTRVASMAMINGTVGAIHFSFEAADELTHVAVGPSRARAVVEVAKDVARVAVLSSVAIVGGAITFAILLLDQKE